MNVSLKPKKPSFDVFISEEEYQATKNLLDHAHDDISKDSLQWEKWIELPDRKHAIRLEVISPLTPSQEPCWSQCGLFEHEVFQWPGMGDDRWNELGYSDVGESIEGEWEFEHLIVNVKVMQPQEAKSGSS